MLSKNIAKKNKITNYISIKLGIRKTSFKSQDRLSSSKNKIDYTLYQRIPFSFK